MDENGLHQKENISSSEGVQSRDVKSVERNYQNEKNRVTVFQKDTGKHETFVKGN